MQLGVGKTYTLKSDKTATAKVIAEVSGEGSPKRYWVEISEKNFRNTPWCGEYLPSGIHVAGYTKYDLTEIPPDQVKQELWITLFKNYNGQVFHSSHSDKVSAVKGAIFLQEPRRGNILLARKKIIITEGEFDE